MPDRSRSPQQLAIWISALIGLIAVALSIKYPWWDLRGHQSTLLADGPVSEMQKSLFYVTCWVTLVIFIFVGGALAYATVKFKARTEADEHAEPPAQGHGNPLIEVGLIGASVLALVIIAIPTLRGIWYEYDVPAQSKANAYEVTATGYQWWFQFQYPGEQIPGSGPLTTANELVIPAGRPVHVNLRSIDVMHSFWVPRLAGKVDMIPNRANFLWLESDKPGYFWGQCAEFCGDSHALMRFRVIALSPRDFEDWLSQQMQPAREVAPHPRARARFASLPMKEFPENAAGVSDKFEGLHGLTPLDEWKQQQFPEKNEDPALIAKGKELFTTKTCAGCHTIRQADGKGPVGVTGPNLTHVAARTTIAGGLLENNASELRRWIHNPGAVKPGNIMWEKGYLVNNIHLTPEDETALVAYLQSLK
jgi:cytochrome c oxidase subunit 2